VDHRDGDRREPLTCGFALQGETTMTLGTFGTLAGKGAVVTGAAAGIGQAT
jgi:hypothetical protein